MLLKTQPTPEPFANPELTAVKKVRQAQEQGFRTESSVPGLSGHRFEAAFGPHTFGQPLPYEMTLRVPLGCSVSALDSESRQRVVKWVGHMASIGLDLCNEHRLQFYPGVYPAVDPTTNLALLGEREYVVRAWFRSRNPKPTTLEIPAHLTETVRAAGANRPPES